MPITLIDLYQKTSQKYKLKLIAGEEGLHNIVSWVQFTEDIMTIDFLKGSELILTTGLNANSKNWTTEFINELIKQKSSGLIINTGKYILEEDINQFMVTLCNKNKFPLFIMPWDVHLSDIMQDYCNRLLSNSHLQDNVTAIMKSILFHPETISSCLEELKIYGYGENDKYGIALIKPAKMKDLEEKTSLFHIQVRNILKQNLSSYHMFSNDKRLVIIIHQVDEVTVKRVMVELIGLSSISNIGVGEIQDNLNNISKSYIQAGSALKTACGKKEKQSYFVDLGIYRILFSTNDRTMLEKIYKESLGVIEEYDKKHNCSLLEILKLYIQYDGSIQMVAKETFTHRNTINYRVKKIKELLNDNMETMESKFRLQMAFYIKTYLQF